MKGQALEAAPAQSLPKTLAGKMAAVSAALGTIAKDGRNDHFQYDYVTAASVLSAVRGALTAHGVTLIPSVHQVEQVSATLVRLWLRLLWMDAETSETIETMWVGDGSDKGDKGIYKAYTGTMKYALIQTFLIPTGDDPEADDQPPVGARGTQDWIDDGALYKLAAAVKVNLDETLTAGGTRLQQLNGAERKKLAEWLAGKGVEG